MKKIITILAFLAFIASFSQVPQGISYQAIALNNSGNPLASSSVGIRLSVLDNSLTGTNLYSETQTKTTNPQGLFNLVIGQGTATTGTFSAINWGSNSKFLKVEIDVAGGTNYVLIGTTQLLSVPYALFAEKADSISQNALNGYGTNSLKNSSYIITDGNTVKGFSNGMWTAQIFSNFPTATNIFNSNGNFVVTDGNSVKAFSNGIWTSQAFSNFPTTTNTFHSNGNFIITDGNSVKAFSNGNWTSQAFSNFPTTTNIFISNGNFIITDGNSIKGFSNGIWSTQAFSNFPTTTNIFNSNGNFIITDGNSVKAFSNGNWTVQAFSNFPTSTNTFSSEKN